MSQEKILAIRAVGNNPTVLAALLKSHKAG